MLSLERKGQTFKDLYTYNADTKTLKRLTDLEISKILSTRAKSSTTHTARST